MSARLGALHNALIAGLVVAGTAVPAWSAPTLVASKPLHDEATHELTVFVGGLDEGGRSIKGGQLALVLDGDSAGPLLGSSPLSDWAATSAEESSTWRPPLAVGLVYLWVDGVPPGLLEGIHAFFQRLPPRTTVYPTIYGRLRQGRARLPAADIGRLDELPYLESYRPNLADAVAMNLADVGGDDVPLRLLLLVTDGRDFADPKGEGPGDFAALGRRLRSAGVTPIVVGFPPRDPADAAAAAANLRDLHAAAGGFLRVLERNEDLENTLESLGQGLADLSRVRVAEPFSWRLFAGSHRVSARLLAPGQHLSAEIGVVAIAGGGGAALFAILGVIVLAVAALIIVLVRRRRGAAGGDEAGDDDDDLDESDEEELVTATHDLIRRGVSPQRAVDELLRERGGAARKLITLDPEILNDPRFPYFRTRPGRLRIKEIQDILSKKAAARPALGGTLADFLAQAVKDGVPPASAAASLSARVTPEEATAFAAMSLEDLAGALREASQRRSALASPRARGAVVAVQDALRANAGSDRGIAVGWLVRVGGPGRYGETIRLLSGRTTLGRGHACLVRLDGDLSISEEHAEIVLAKGDFAVAPLSGEVAVEGQPVGARHVLSDGETISLGAGRFVFKSASSGRSGQSLAGTAGSAVSGARPATARRRAPR